MFLIFLASALAIVGASICIAISTNWILTCSWGWAENSAKTGFGYSLLLGIVTSIPEMITVITLLKLKNVNAAIGDILGSNMFSCLILSIIDLIYWHGDDTLFGPGNEEAQIISFWCFVSMLFFGCILLIDYWFRNRRHGKLFYGLNITALSLMFLTYVTYLVCAVVDPHIFDLTIHQSYATLLSSSVNDLCQNINCGRLYLS
jgi:Ca2+/Na+ antiporter